MIPKEIALQIIQLKEKSKYYSSIYRNYEIDEIRADVVNINNEISSLNRNVGNILVDGIISNFEIDNWFESLMDKSDFIEPNPRLVYEEEQLELEIQREEAEKKARHEIEERKERLKIQRIEEFRKICYYGPDNIDRIQKLVNDGINITQADNNMTYSLATLIGRGRSVEFIQYLIVAGMNIKASDISYCLKSTSTFSSVNFLNSLISARNIEKEAIEMVKVALKQNAIKEAEEHQKKLQTQRIDEYRKIWHHGPDNIDGVQKLIADGLDINQPTVCPTLTDLIKSGRNLKFITFLIASGIEITQSDVEYCLKSKSPFNSVVFLDLLISAKNIDGKAVKIAKAGLKKKAEEEKLNKLRELTHGQYDSFNTFLTYSDLNEIKELIIHGVIDVNQKIQENTLGLTFPILSIFVARGIPFIQFLVDIGYIVTKENLDYYYRDSVKSLYSKQIVNVLITAKNIEKEAFLIVVQILKSNEQIRIKQYECEQENKNRELQKAIKDEEQHQKNEEIPKVLLTSKNIEDDAIALMEEIKKEPEILSDIVPSNEASVQIIGEKTKVKKNINSKYPTKISYDLILMIAISIIIIALIALFVIYFDQVIAFLKVLLVFVVVIALFVWRYSPKKRR